MPLEAPWDPNKLNKTLIVDKIQSVQMPNLELLMNVPTASVIERFLVQYRPFLINGTT